MNQKIFRVLAGIIILGAIVYGASYWYTHRDPYAGLTTTFEIEMDEATKSLIDSRLSTTLAAIDAAKKSGEEVDANLYQSASVDFYLKGDLVNAREYLETYLAINPLSYIAWNNYGDVLEKMTDYVGAEKAYRKAIEIQGGTEEYYRDLYNLISVHYPERKTEAKQVLELSVDKVGQTNWNMIMLGRWYAVARDCDKAEAHYKVAKSLAPENVSIADEYKEVVKECGGENVDWSWE